MTGEKPCEPMTDVNLRSAIPISKVIIVVAVLANDIRNTCQLILSSAFCKNGCLALGLWIFDLLIH